MKTGKVQKPLIRSLSLHLNKRPYIFNYMEDTAMGELKRIAFFDTRPYDRTYFDAFNNGRYEIDYIESKLSSKTAALAKGADAVCIFVNDNACKDSIDALCGLGIKVIALRCAGYSNVDFKAARHRISVLRVPAYSPYAVAEHAIALLQTVNRKTHRAYNRTRDYNFNISGLEGQDLHGKTAGVIGTGKIGRIFIDICRGFGMKVIAYDLYPAKDSGIDYVDLDTLFRESDIISLHCPLTKETEHIVNAAAFDKMKKNAIIINTSRGALIDTIDLLDALMLKKISGAGLDVYEEEASFFFQDYSDKGIPDDILALLLAKPNVVMTSHQAFFTKEALENIATITLQNLDDYFAGKELINEVRYTKTEDRIMEGLPRKKS